MNRTTIIRVTLAIVSLAMGILSYHEQDTTVSNAQALHSVTIKDDSLPVVAHVAKEPMYDISALHMTQGYRPNACHTWNTGVGMYNNDSIDAIMCNPGLSDKTERDDTDETINTPVMPVYNEETPVIVDNVPADKKEKHDNGNHYGNDKPDNNEKDNSKFDGCDSREDFDNVRGKNKNK